MKSNRETAHGCRRTLVLPNVFIVHLKFSLSRSLSVMDTTHYDLLTSQTPSTRQCHVKANIVTMEQKYAVVDEFVDREINSKGIVTMDEQSWL